MNRTRAVLVLVLVVLLAGCSNDPPAPPSATPVPTPPAEPSRIVVGVDGLTPGFNPHLLAHLGPVTSALSTLVLPSVFRPDATGTPRLDTTIATSAEVTATVPFTVSYELDLEASWSSNAPIAAEDFVYLWERMRADPGVVDAAGYRLITEVRSRAGGKAVDVVFAQPYPAWPRLFSGLLPAHILKDAPGSWTGALTDGYPVSGGPFRILSVDRARGEVVLGRNDLYWATPAVLDTLVLRRLDGAGTAAALASGDVAIVLPEADPGVRTALGGLDPPPTLQLAPESTVTQLGLRADTGPLSDPSVRQGIAALVDREAVRAAVAPEALPADAFGPAPSQAGYAPTAPVGAPARPDPVAAATQLAAAGWTRDLVSGRWAVDGAPARLVIGAAAERPEDLRVAQVVASQLDAAGIDVTIVAPPGVDLFGLSAVPAVPPAGTPTPAAGTPIPTPAPTTPRTTPTVPPSRSTAATSTAAPTPTADPSVPPGSVRVDLLVTPRTVGGDPGTELASDFGCPQPTALVPDPPRQPGGFCFPTLQPLLDELLAPDPRPETTAAVERVLWAQLPALPLFQPVTLVASTRAADTATAVGPGPLGTGPLTGAEDWRPPTG